ncbi:MAG: hypothetical protein LH632_21620 [Rhodoferax sp.]|nr:hypothetical protein [Rhodoferax sp.]
MAGHPLFVHVLEPAREIKLRKLGTFCLEGTNIHGNASRHSALSQGQIEKRAGQRKAEVAKLFALAESADQTNRLEVMAAATTKN